MRLQPDPFQENPWINAKSVSTGNAKRDGHLASADFLSAAQFPAIIFESDSLESSDGKKYRAKGTLTFRGKSREIAVDLERIGTKKAMGGLRTGFEGSFTINRSDFGADWGVKKGILGNEVKIILAIEGIRK